VPETPFTPESSQTPGSSMGLRHLRPNPKQRRHYAEARGGVPLILYRDSEVTVFCAKMNGHFVFGLLGLRFGALFAVE
jgi:hypothetical protein